MWRTVKLKDVCSVFTDGDWIETKDQSAEGIRLVQTGNVKTGSFADRKDKARYISDETFVRLNCTEVMEGDILVSRLPEPVGRACVIPKLQEKAITAVDCTVIRTKEEVLPTYLNYYMQSPQYFSLVQEKVTGATRQRISRKNLGEVLVSIPPLAEQQRIVAKLDAAFAEIDRAIELMNENLHLAEQSMESFLTDIIINADNICHKRLGDACKFSQGVQVPKPEQSETLSDEHPQRFLRIIDFTSEGMEPPRYISQRGKKYHMTENDVALVRYGNPGFVCRGLEGTLANNLFKVIPRTDELDDSYLYYFLKSGLFQRAIRLKAHGVAMQAISFSLISDIELLLPPTVFQKKIVKKAEAIEAKLLQLEDYYSEKLHLLERLKSSLLAQELQPPQSDAA